MGIKVLSLFDGISCGMVALERAGIEVDRYVAYEIDKYAIQVSQKNYPQIEHRGDVTIADFTEFQGFDLLIGGSPCQGFSFAGKQLNFNDPRSALFFEYARALTEVQPKYFLLENVVMRQEHQDVISKIVGVSPVKINSELVCAQTRNRLYWTNLKNLMQPEDKKIYWGDVRERGVHCPSMYYSDAAMDWIARHGVRKKKKLKVHQDCEKMQMIEASHYKKYSSQRFFGIIDRPTRETGIEPYTKCSEVYKQLKDGERYRYITPLECERLQTLPDHYTYGISNTQRYKSIGNGWTVDVIAHIFKQMEL